MIARIPCVWCISVVVVVMHDTIGTCIISGKQIGKKYAKYIRKHKFLKGKHGAQWTLSKISSNLFNFSFFLNICLILFSPKHFYLQHAFLTLWMEWKELLRTCLKNRFRLSLLKENNRQLIRFLDNIDTKKRFYRSACLHLQFTSFKSSTKLLLQVWIMAGVDWCSRRRSGTNWRVIIAAQHIHLLASQFQLIRNFCVFASQLQKEKFTIELIYNLFCSFLFQFTLFLMFF